MSVHRRSTSGPGRRLFLVLLLMASWSAAPRPAEASFVVHRPLHEIFAEADLVALVMRRSAVPDQETDPAAHDAQDVVFEVRHVVKATRGEKAGDRITLRTYGVPNSVSPGNELGQANARHPFATYLAFLTWDEEEQAYRPGAFSPQVRPAAPPIRNPDARGSTWLSVPAFSWGFCPPVTLPISLTQLDGTAQCAGFKLPFFAWFTLEDFERQDWAALGPSAYPIEHVRRCEPAYVLASEPLGRISLETSKPIQLWEPNFRACWQSQLAREPARTSGRYVERVVFREGKSHFPFGPTETVSTELTDCLHEALNWGSPHDELGPGTVEVELKLELTSEPRWGFDPNPHFR